MNKLSHKDSFYDFLEEQIEQNRKGDFQLKLLDKHGDLITPKEITAKLIKHEFVFGVCPNGHISMTNELACKTGEDSDKYWKLIGDLFNGTSLWWGWRVLEPELGKWTFDQEVNGYGPMEAMLQRAEKLDHHITGHALLYPRRDVSPDWVPDFDPEHIVEELEKHVRYTVRRYKDRVHYWHPVNEAYEPLQTVGNLQINEGMVYRWVKEEAPHSQLVNNGGYTIHPDFYEKGISNAELYGAHVDYLGIRGYFELFNPDYIEFYMELWQYFDHLVERYGKQLKFTEIGAVSAPINRSYEIDPTIIEQIGITQIGASDCNVDFCEVTQADFLVSMYKTIFAHPAMHECSYWDLLDNYTWNEVEGGLVRSDFTPKPAYYKLQELIHQEWSTNVQVQANPEGVYDFRGFYGKYEIEIDNKIYHVHFTKDCPAQIKMI
ncbi:endo-1,4-beta-xylanase [Paenibacillus sp. FSL K6-0276]|uniref:endo-1,4-beta-xylanase n=1 Tax=Paenibacillus sp. FSL K6-0276 TaxID=2921450 RepID=UPI0030EC2E70